MYLYRYIRRERERDRTFILSLYRLKFSDGWNSDEPWGSKKEKMTAILNLLKVLYADSRHIMI